MRTFILRQPDDGQALIAYLKEHAGQMVAAGTPLQVTVAPYKATRSNEQNARFWVAVVTPIAEQVAVNGTKFDAETWAHFLKEKLLPETCARGVDKWLMLPDGSRTLSMSTTHLNTEEFSEFMERCEAYAATELGVRFIDHEH